MKKISEIINSASKLGITVLLIIVTISVLLNLEDLIMIYNR